MAEICWKQFVCPLSAGSVQASVGSGQQYEPAQAKPKGHAAPPTAHGMYVPIVSRAASPPFWQTYEVNSPL